MAEQAEHIWFLEPLNDRTSEVISKSQGVKPENYHPDKICADKNAHNLWEVPSGTAFMLHCCRTDMKLRMRVWYQEGRGKIYNKTRWLSKERGTARKKKKRKKAYARF